MQITKTRRRFLIFVLILFVFGALGLSAQDGGSKTLNGVQYSVYIPEDFSRYADYGDYFNVGDKIVIAGQVMRISGAYLSVRNAGAANRFVLEAPTRLDFGTEVTVYGEIVKVNAEGGVETKIVKLEGPKGNGQIPTQNETRTLDGTQYKILQPEEYAFYIDMEQLKVGDKYVIDDNVMSVTDTALILRNTGTNRFSLSSPQRIPIPSALRIYFEIAGVSPVEAKIVKLEIK
jgi:hypothetical protein